MPRVQLSNFQNYEKSELLDKVKIQSGHVFTESILVVAGLILEMPEFSCTINITAGENELSFIEKWTSKYISGYNNRPSQRISNPIGTYHDSILDEIISSRISNSIEDIDAIKYGHRLAMSAENITGSLLEEYLAIELIEYDWHCCWGETVKSIDFCNSDGQLLQIKNSDNSENSSSKTVRDGTEIKHWFRRFSKTGKTNWDALNSLIGIVSEEKKLSEESFRAFVRTTVNSNPSSIYIEESSPWYNKKSVK